MPSIGKNTIDKCAEHLKGLLETYSERLDEAYKNADGDLAVGLSLKIKPKNGANAIVAGISFVVEKETDTSSFDVSEEQMEISFEKGGAR